MDVSKVLMYFVSGIGFALIVGLIGFIIVLLMKLYDKWF